MIFVIIEIRMVSFYPRSWLDVLSFRSRGGQVAVRVTSNEYLRNNQLISNSRLHYNLCESLRCSSIALRCMLRFSSCKNKFYTSKVEKNDLAQLTQLAQL